MAAVINEGRLPELVTDLTEEEYARFCPLVVVVADDVLDVHNFLRDFDGDFSRLFSKE